MSTPVGVSISQSGGAQPRMCVESLIRHASNGRMFILVDDDASASGSLVVPAQMVTPAAVNFMASHGRGLICLALTQQRVAELGLPIMGEADGEPLKDTYTVSIEAKDGVSTGISAADRAHTILAAIGLTGGSGEIVTPGHVFPVVAQAGGVLMRAGHVEAAVDIVRLAGLNPSAVVCKIIGRDGSLAGKAELLELSKEYGLPIGTVLDLIGHRRCHDHLVEKCSDVEFRMPNGGVWRAISYRNLVNSGQQVALVKGCLNGEEPTLVRMHALSLFDDFLGCPGPRQNLLKRSIAAIEAAGNGVIVLMHSEEFETRLSIGSEEPDEHDADLRSYGFGAQVLADLNVNTVALLTHKQVNAIAIEGWGISISAQHLI